MVSISVADRRILRDCAQQVAEIAALPVMGARRRMWFRHNRLERVRPMILVFPEGAWRELLPVSALRCESEPARAFEWELRRRIFHHKYLHDDAVIEARWVVRKAYEDSGWGVAPRRVPSPSNTGSWAFDPVLFEPSDLAKFKFPVVTHDERATAERVELAHELFNGILKVVPKGATHLSFHMMKVFTDFRGLENGFADMVEQPEFVHQAMSFIEAGYRRLVQQYVELNLLSLNNDESYHSSGGVGYSDELPKAGFDPQRVRPCDMWASAESQELTRVSPGMHREFALEYEKRLLAPFGLNGYGCCDVLTEKLDDVLTIPNIRRISVCPWADVERCAEKLGNHYIFSWKPQPAHLVGEFDKVRVRDYLRHALDVTRGCVIEMILKDTHTCERQPERFTMWADIAQELAAEY